MLEAVIQKDDFCILNGFQGAGLLLSRPEGSRLSHISAAVVREGLDGLFGFMNRKRRQDTKDVKAGRILSQSWVHGGGQRTK